MPTSIGNQPPSAIFGRLAPRKSRFSRTNPITPSAIRERGLRQSVRATTRKSLLTRLLGAAVVWLMGDPCRPVFPAHRRGAVDVVRCVRDEIEDRVRTLLTELKASTESPA